MKSSGLCPKSAADVFPAPPFTLANAITGIPGRTDGNGGHTCRTNCASWGLATGEYHTHGGGSSTGSTGGSYTAPVQEVVEPVRQVIMIPTNTSAPIYIPTKIPTKIPTRIPTKTPIRAPGSIRTENAVQQSHCKIPNFCNGLPAIGLAGLSLLQKSAAKVQTFAISFATERTHNPCDHGVEQVSSYRPNSKCIFCSDAPRSPYPMANYLSVDGLHSREIIIANRMSLGRLFINLL